MIHTPILMESYFNPGFKTTPAVHVGSQTIPFFYGKAKEQAWEGWHLVGTNKGDVIVVRNFDVDYIRYWNSLMEGVEIINLPEIDNGIFLTEAILKDRKFIERIKHRMKVNSKLMVFLPTQLEQKLADILSIPLHGSPKISSLYGTKSGIRKLAKEYNISMPNGLTCKNYLQVQEAIDFLSEDFEEVVIKHDLSVSGYFTKRWQTKYRNFPKKTLDIVAGGKFVENEDIVVVEGWLKTKTSLCAHIEILDNQKPIICGAWQQIIDTDGVSFIGASPLRLSIHAMESFVNELNRLATALKEKGAVGSYGPDFVVVSDDEKNAEPDTCVLIELNARVPYTAFPLETIKQIKGKIGNAFLIRHIKLATKMSFLEIIDALKNENLLITEKDSNARGVIPFNIGLLPWKLFDVIVISDSWEKVLSITEKVHDIFEKN